MADTRRGRSPGQVTGLVGSGFKVTGSALDAAGAIFGGGRQKLPLAKFSRREKDVLAATQQLLSESRDVLQGGAATQGFMLPSLLDQLGFEADFNDRSGDLNATLGELNATRDTIAANMNLLLTKGARRGPRKSVV